MGLDLDLPLSGHVVRRVEPRAVVVGDERLQRSFLLAPDILVRDWPFTHVDAIDLAAAEDILALAPELVLIGSGSRQAFVEPSVQAGFLRQNVGIECMDNHACARTYNLLAGEGRRVIAAFLLPDAG